MEYIHPKRREIRSFDDLLLKILDIFYFYKKGEELGKTKKRLNLLKLVGKRKFGDRAEEVEKEINKAKDILKNHDKNAYEEYISYLEKEHKSAIEKLNKEKKSSLLSFFK